MDALARGVEADVNTGSKAVTVETLPRVGSTVTTWNCTSSAPFAAEGESGHPGALALSPGLIAKVLPMS